MRKFIKKTLLYFFIFMVPLVALDAYVRQPFCDEYAAKYYFLKDHLADCEILLMGSSHTQTGLNPEWMNWQSVNVANLAQPFYYDYKILKEYTGKIKNLKTVVLSLSYPSFFSNPTKRHENLYSIYWGMSPYSGKMGIENYSVVMALGLENAISRVLNLDTRDEHLGWMEVGGKFNGSLEAAQDKLQDWHGQMNENNWEECTGWLNKIIDHCTKNNIHLILYLPPFSTSLNQLLAADHYQQKILAYVQELKKDNAVKIIDANDGSINNDSLFKDPDHVNVFGAKILTARINETINQLRS